MALMPRKLDNEDILTFPRSLCSAFHPPRAMVLFEANLHLSRAFISHLAFKAGVLSESPRQSEWIFIGQRNERVCEYYTIGAFVVLTAVRSESLIIKS